jgi:hypothetical protein
VAGGRLVIEAPTGLRRYADPHGAGLATYDTASWRSPVVEPGYAFEELVPSWNADTPEGTWLEVAVHVVAVDGRSGRFVLGRWAGPLPLRGKGIHRTSVPGQSTAWATVATDTLVGAGGARFRSWQLELVLLRPPGTTATPAVRLAAAMTSASPSGADAAVSRPGPAPRGAELAVPTLSQEVHAGHYPQWDGGGEAWCSPTAVAMVLGYWGTGPSAADTAWVAPPVDAVVDHAARHVYDHAYHGTGNWPFNTAYAAGYGLDATVTRLRSLAEAEAFVAAGIPLVASVSFQPGELPGAGYATAGHLLVIRGFTAEGDVVVNDPASHQAPDNGRVRVVYDRAAFERVWLPRSGGLVYVVRPPAHPLPPPPAQANW